MKLHTLVLEGDKAVERKEGEELPPARTKSEYPRRRRRESLPLLHNRSFYLCRILEEELRGTVIDGSGKITICAHNDRVYPGAEKYICHHDFHISIYYLDKEQIDAIEKAADEDTEQEVLSGILRDALLDIAGRSGCSKGVMEKIETAFTHMADSGFAREERIARLSKRSKDTGLTARVYRVLSRETGEGWYLEMVDRKGTVLCRETMGSDPGYVDRLGSRLYAKAEWRGDTFVIVERFGKEVFRIRA